MSAHHGPRVSATAPLFGPAVDAREWPLLAAREACARMLAARHGATKAALRREMVAQLVALTSRSSGGGSGSGGRR